MQYPALFAAFDIFPSAKGVSTHITHNAKTLFQHFEGGCMYVLADDKLPLFEQIDTNQSIIRFPSNIPNYLQRADAYSQSISQFLRTQHQLKLCHFRDIWSGLPILMHAKSSGQKYQTIFEVNGLPSIELPYRYPMLGQNTLQKLAHLEQFCMQNADYILTPSHTIKQNLINRGIDTHKIEVISNGAIIPQKKPTKPRNSPKKYIIYFGALQTWQGIETLLNAFTHLKDIPDLQLVICSSVKKKQTKALQKLIDKKGLTDRVIWQFELKAHALYRWVKHAIASVAPLKACSRNISQGCCPLKILESMALATPVIASNLPAVREIIFDNSVGKLVPPDRPAELARAIKLMIENTKQTKLMGKKAQQLIQEQFTWEQKCAELTAFYQRINNRKFKIQVKYR